MASPVSICSNALLKLGAGTIADFTENTVSATLCANLWPQVRDAVLRAHPWNCAVKRANLAPKTTVPVYGYSFAFALPADCLRLLEADTAYDYKVEGRDVLGDENPLYIRYIFKNEDVASYDTLLVDALTAAMQAELAYPITKSTAQQEASWRLYSEKLKLARSVDASEDSPDQFGSNSPLLDVRGI